MSWTLAGEGSTTPSHDGEPLVVRAPMGNLFWLENSSGENLDVKYYVNSQVSPSLPQTADAPTRLDNSLAGSSGKLEVEINGEKTTLIDNIDPAWINSPTDVKGGLVVGEKKSSQHVDPNPRIPFDPKASPVDSRILLPDNALGNTEVDAVAIIVSAPSPFAIQAEGVYQVDTLSDNEVYWVLESFMQNSVATSANEFSVAVGQVVKHGRSLGTTAARAFLKEVILNGRFAVKNISSWGGKAAIVFKGNHRSRSFLTAIMYGVKNDKMAYISSYAEIANDALNSKTSSALSRAGSASMPLKSGNFIGFFIAAAFDVNAFIKDEDPEKNWGDLLGMLGATFVKVWAAGFVGLIAATAAIATIGAPVVVAIIVGAGVAIMAGMLLDWIDNVTGFKEGMRKIGRGLIDILDSASTFSLTQIDILLDSWEDDFKSSLRQNDPTGYCALFCSDPLAQLDAWMRGLTGRGLGGRF